MRRSIFTARYSVQQCSTVSMSMPPISLQMWRGKIIRNDFAFHCTVCIVCWWMPSAGNTLTMTGIMERVPSSFKYITAPPTCTIQFLCSLQQRHIRWLLTVSLRSTQRGLLLPDLSPKALTRGRLLWERPQQRNPRDSFKLWKSNSLKRELWRWPENVNRHNERFQMGKCQFQANNRCDFIRGWDTELIIPWQQNIFG